MMVQMDHQASPETEDQLANQDLQEFQEALGLSALEALEDLVENEVYPDLRERVVHLDDQDPPDHQDHEERLG